jgi:diguanylate cyclase (GGDEF)-like protein
MPPVATGRRARRRAPHEAPVVVRLLAHVPPWARAGGNAAAAGRVLLLFGGAVVILGALCLGVDGHGLAVLAGTSGAMLGLVALSLRVSWHADGWGTLAFPLALLLALGTVGLTTSGVASAFVGLIPMCFVYAGLFHPGRAAFALLPAAFGAYIAMATTLDGRAVVRLLVYAVTWWGTAQVIALATAYQRDVRRRLRTDARTDALTSLGNRRDLDERLAGAQAGDCVVIADLDHFKRVNDTRGHAAGDLVLERFGHVLAEHLRRRDYAARYGGEEFVLILPRTEPVQAMNTLRALRAEWAEEGTGVTFSAGIALITPGTPAASALAAADIALYRAKQAGRDRFRIATEGLAAARRPPADPQAPGPHGPGVRDHSSDRPGGRRDLHAGC